MNLGLNFMGWEGISVPVGKQAMDQGSPTSKVHVFSFGPESDLGHSPRKHPFESLGLGQTWHIAKIAHS